MRCWVRVLIVIALQASAGAAESAVQGGDSAVAPQSQLPRPGSASSATSTGQGSSAADVQLPVSLEKIRKELEDTPPPAPPAIRIGELPTFRVTVYGQKKMTLPPFEETLKQAWQPIVPGGIHNKEVMDLITPPQARPFGAFENQGLVEVAGTAFVSALIQRALVKGYHALRGQITDWQEEQIRREVAAELAAFLLANPQPPPEKKGDEKK